MCLSNDTRTQETCEHILFPLFTRLVTSKLNFSTSHKDGLTRFLCRVLRAHTYPLMVPAEVLNFSLCVHCDTHTKYVYNPIDIYIYICIYSIWLSLERYKNRTMWFVSLWLVMLVSEFGSIFVRAHVLSGNNGLCL